MFKQLVDELAENPERLQQIRRLIQNSPESTNRLEYLKCWLSPNLLPLEEDWHFNDLMNDLKKAPVESFILFAIGTGFGAIYPDACYQQMIPNYFKILARRYPNLKAKIFLIDPCFSKQVVRLLYPRLKKDNWKKKHDLANIIEFEKENMEIAFYRLEVPHKYSRHPEGSLLMKQIFKAYFSSYIAKHWTRNPWYLLVAMKAALDHLKLLTKYIMKQKKVIRIKVTCRCISLALMFLPFQLQKYLGTR